MFSFRVCQLTILIYVLSYIILILVSKIFGGIDTRHGILDSEADETPLVCLGIRL